MRHSRRNIPTDFSDGVIRRWHLRLSHGAPCWRPTYRASLTHHLSQSQLANAQHATATASTIGPPYRTLSCSLPNRPTAVSPFRAAKIPPPSPQFPRDRPAASETDTRDRDVPRPELTSTVAFPFIHIPRPLPALSWSLHSFLSSRFSHQPSPSSYLPRRPSPLACSHDSLSAQHNPWTATCDLRGLMAVDGPPSSYWISLLSWTKALDIPTAASALKQLGSPSSPSFNLLSCSFVARLVLDRDRIRAL